MTASVRISRLAVTITHLTANAEEFTGHCFRCVKPVYSSSLDAFSGEGTLKTSGRFHVIGKVLVVYTSTDLKTAEWEYTNTARSRGFDSAHLLPYTAISANVKLSKVLNLSNSAVRKMLKVTLKELRGAPWDSSATETLTQVIGRLAYEAGFEAILAPSGGGGQNLNVFRQNLLTGSLLQIINADELPSS